MGNSTGTAESGAALGLRAARGSDESLSHPAIVTRIRTGW